MLQEPHLSGGTPGLPGSTLGDLCAHAADAAATLNRATADWHAAAAAPSDALLQLHQANFDLWHLEDEARNPHSGDAAVAAVKRSIDAVNQRRNDIVERIDVALIASLTAQGVLNAGAPLHSETPGQMFDRLSILSLKMFHTAAEAMREDVHEDHREQSRARLAVLQEQQADLASCLTDLWREVLQGARRIKLYRQHKMYNDPALNPVLYRHRTRSTAAPFPEENSSNTRSS